MKATYVAICLLYMAVVLQNGLPTRPSCCCNEGVKEMTIQVQRPSGLFCAARAAKTYKHAVAYYSLPTVEEEGSMTVNSPFIAPLPSMADSLSWRCAIMLFLHVAGMKGATAAVPAGDLHTTPFLPSCAPAR